MYFDHANELMDCYAVVWIMYEKEDWQHGERARCHGGEGSEWVNGVCGRYTAIVLQTGPESDVNKRGRSTTSVDQLVSINSASITLDTEPFASTSGYTQPFIRM